MFNKIKVYLPFTFYDVNFRYWKKRDLNEIEAIILLNIYLNKKKSSSANVIDSLLKNLNLSPNKWTEFITKILLEMNNKEITFDKNIDWNLLINNDIEIEKNIIESIKEDKYYGLDKSDISKTKKIYLNLFNKELINDDKPLASIKINNINLLDNIAETNKFIKDKLDSIGEEIYKDNYVYDKFNLNNVLDFNDNNNLVFLEKDFKIDIDFIQNKININSKDFYDIKEFYEKLNFSDDFKEMISKSLDNFKSFENLDEEECNNLKTTDEYNKVLNNLKENNICDKNYIIFNGAISKITYSWKEFLVNDDIKISLPILSYRIIETNEIIDLLNENVYNYNFVNLLNNINNENQIKIIEEYILNEYKTNINKPFYSDFIINNISKINKIDKKWLFNPLLEIEHFKKIFQNNNFLINEIKDLEIKIESNKFNYDKLNYLFNNYSLKIKDLHIDLEQYNNEQKLILNIEKEIKNGNFNNKLKDLFAKEILLNENKENIDELKRKNKDIIVEEIISLIKKKIVGYLDEYVRKYSDSDDRTTIDECIKKIEQNETITKEKIQDLYWIKKYRNEVSHEKEDKLLNLLKSKNLDDLIEDHKRILKIVEEINK